MADSPRRARARVRARWRAQASRGWGLARRRAARTPSSSYLSARPWWEAPPSSSMPPRYSSSSARASFASIFFCSSSFTFQHEFCEAGCRRCVAAGSHAAWRGALGHSRSRAPGSRAQPSRTPRSCRTSRATSSTSPCRRWSPGRARCQSRAHSGCQTASPSRSRRLRSGSSTTREWRWRRVNDWAGPVRRTVLLSVVAVPHEEDEADKRGDETGDKVARTLARPWLSHMPAQAGLDAPRSEGVHRADARPCTHSVTRGPPQIHPPAYRTLVQLYLL